MVWTIHPPTIVPTCLSISFIPPLGTDTTHTWTTDLEAQIHSQKYGTVFPRVDT
jgi:hypothetical protein